MTDEWPPFRDPRVVLRAHDLVPKRAFSQNFLVARGVVEAIADAVGIAPGDPVVEIGAGLGTLTAALVRRGARVTAIEPDRDMQRVLAAELRGAPQRSEDATSPAGGAGGGEAPRRQLGGHLHAVVAADAARVLLATLRAPTDPRWLVVGNLPYQATGAIVRALIEQREQWRRAILMVQREVAERLVAGADTDAYGALSVFVQAGCSVRRVRDVSPGSFHPPPKVWSSVVSLEPLDPPRAHETDAFRDVVRAGFAQRRKTLRNALCAIAGARKDDVEHALADAAIDGKRRAETLTVEELARLAEAFDARRTR